MLDVLDGISDVVCTCSSSQWFSILSSRALNRTPSHMCGRFYLPMFLLGMALFTIINMNSLIVLAKICHSLPTMLKLSSVVVWLVVDW